MKIIRFLSSKTFVVNLVVIAIVAILGIFALQKYLDVITDHGEVVVVPDLSTYSLSQVENELEGLGLSYEIMDSSEFKKNYPPGSVVDQYPNPGSEVKNDRTIKLTLNPLSERKLELPDVIDIPRIDAVYRLESRGFKVGQVRYVPDLGKDNVLAVEINGKRVEVGEKFEKGTKFDFVLGMGLSEERVAVPSLYGLPIDSVEIALHSRMLNLGAVLYDESVEDSAAAKVYKQTPVPTGENVIRMGDGVDIWLTDDYTKIPSNPLLPESIIDSTTFFNDGL